MKRLFQVLALISALIPCISSSAVGEACARPAYPAFADSAPSIVNSSSAAPGAAEQPLGCGAFSARYPGYVAYKGDSYASTSQTEGWCEADRLFTANSFSFEVTNCESFVSLRKEADQNSERILKVGKGEVVYVNGEYGAWSLCLYSGRYGWIKTQYLRSVDPWFNRAEVYYSNISCNEPENDSRDYQYSERALSADEVEAYASSELTDAYGSYPAWKACDGYTTSTWSEGVSGVGRGEYLGFRFEPAYVTSLSI